MLILSSIRPYFTDPLIWIGVVLILIFLLIKYLLNKNVITQLPDWLASEASKKLIKHGYLLGILVTILGFGLQHHELNKAEQNLTKNLINTEVKNNLATIQYISKNIQILLDSHQILYEALRHTDSKIMQYLFPTTVQDSDKNKQLSQRVEVAFNALKESNLLKKTAAMNALNSSKKRINVIIHPIHESLNVMRNPAGQNMVIETELWQTHQDVITQLDGFDLAKYEQNLTLMQSLKNEYEQTLEDNADYVDEVMNFLEPSTFIGNGPVFEIITKEKKSLDSLITLNNKIKAVLPELQRMHLD